jgi:hypothetical protein
LFEIITCLTYSAGFFHFPNDKIIITLRKIPKEQKLLNPVAEAAAGGGNS